MSNLTARLCVAASCAGLLAAVGCRPSGAGPSPTAAVQPRETWDVYEITDQRVGAGGIRISPTKVGGQPLVRTEANVRMAVLRAAQATRTEMRLASLTTPSGELKSFECVLLAGAAPVVTRGTVESQRLVLRTRSGSGPEELAEIPWSDDVGGFFATEESLQRKPMRPGEARRFRAIPPIFNVVADVELRAGDVETVELLHSRADLLRIDSTTTLPTGETIAATMWTDEQGEIQKSYTPAAKLTSYRASRDEADDVSAESAFDLNLWSLVQLDRPLDNPHDKRRIRYRVSLSDGDPAATFIADESQQVATTGQGIAEITVTAIRPDTPPAETLTAPANDDDTAPNLYIQSDDPRIRALAAEAAGDARDPWQVAQRLEQFVHERISNKNYAQAFATSVDAANSRAGDCTEHAVLLAALIRARGIPARVVTGLVYIPAENAFGYHMWNEAFIHGRWIGLDGTLGRGGVGPGHLKLGSSSLKDSSAYAAFLPVLSALGKLQIEVVEVE